MSMPRPTPGGTRSSAVADLQRLGEQVVGHVEEVGQLAGAARGEFVRGAEGDGARGADLAVDLVAHHDFQPQTLGQVVDALGGGEPGARGLDADRGGGPAQHLAGDVGGRRNRLVGDERHVEPFHEPPAAEHVVGGAQLFGEEQVEVGHLLHGPQRLGRGPSAVAVDVQLDRIAEAVPQGTHDRGVQRHGTSADLDLEDVDAVGIPHLLGLGDHRRRIVEAQHVTHPHAVGVSAEQAR